MNNYFKGESAMRKKLKGALIFSGVAAFLQGGTSLAADMPVYLLDTVNVTAQAYEKKDLDTPADITVVSKETLKQTGSENVAQALKYQPGIMVSAMGPHDQSWITGNTGVNLRGVSNGGLVMIDGIPVNWNGVSHLDMIPVGAVERVEVVKGGGAVLYGSSAYSGVINVITKKDGENRLRFSAGNHGKRVGSIEAGNEKLTAFYSYDRMGDQGPMTVVPSGGSKTVNGTSYKYDTGFGDSKKQALGVSYKFNDAINAGYMHTEKKYSIEYYAHNAPQVGKIQHFDYKDEEDFIHLAYDKNDLTANLFYQQRKINNPDYYVHNRNAREWELSKQRYWGTDIKQKIDIGNNKLLVGALYKKETYVNDNQKFANSNTGTLKPQARFGQFTSENYALYGSYEYTFNKNLVGVTSFRWDGYDTDRGNFNAFLPQFQLNKKLNDAESVYINVGKSFRMPNMRQLYYSSGMLAANPDLKPEYGWNYEAGYKKKHGKGTFKAAVFHIHLNDMISSRKITVDNNKVSQSYNAAEYKNTGLEISYHEQAGDKLSWHVGGILGNPKKKNTPASKWTDTYSGWQLATGINWKGEKDDLSLSLSWTGDRTSTNSQLKNIGILLNSSLFYTHHFSDSLSASLAVDNIFDRDNITDGGYYAEGRNYMVTMNYKF